MAHLEDQKKLTADKGWKHVIVSHAKEEAKKIKTKAQNVWGGVKVVAKKLKGD